MKKEILELTKEKVETINNVVNNSIDWILNNYDDDKIPTLEEIKMTKNTLKIELWSKNKVYTIEKRFDGKFKSLSIERGSKLVFYKDNGIYKI